MTINFTDTILGTDGEDWLYATANTGSLVEGNGGNDALYGNTGNDSLSGGSGDDRFFAYGGNDTINGGSGFDTYSLVSGLANESVLIEDLAGGERLIMPFTEVGILFSTGEDATGIAHAEVRFATPVNGVTHLFIGYTTLSNELAYLKIDLVGEFNASQFTVIPGLNGPGWPAELVLVDVTPLEGTAGDDVLYANFGINTLIGLDGNDQLYGGGEYGFEISDNLLQGDGGNDTLYGGAGNDELLGGLGNDQLIGGFGVDTLTGGEGYDSFYIQVSDTPDEVDVITDLEGGDYIRIDQSLIIVSANPNELAAGELLFAPPSAGMTRLFLGTDDGPGADVMVDLHGTFSAEDFIVVDAFQGVIRADTSPLFYPDSEAWKITGGRFGDTIYGGSSDQNIAGMGGDDFIDGKSGKDFLAGGAGHDTLIGGEGADVFVLEPSIDSSDLIMDFGTNDSIDSPDENNFYELTDGDGSATKAGQIEVGIPNAGITRLYFGCDTIPGADTIIDLKGNYQTTDFVFGTSWQALLDYNPAANLPKKLIGTSNWNYLSGAGGNDTLIGALSSIDHLDGKGGNDLLQGRDSSDFLTGGFGNDTLDGGEGIDNIYYHHAVVVDLATGKANGEEGNDVLIAIERVDGSDDADVLTGNSESNQLLGWAGNDSISGQGGDDFLEGGTGIDTIRGGAGNDRINVSGNSDLIELFGGDGNDFITSTPYVGGIHFGGPGNDTLYGGNTLIGGAGDDELAQGKSMRGGDGNDAYVVQDLDTTIIEYKGSASGMRDLVKTWLDSYTLPANVENGVILSSGNADLTGNSLNNVLTAGAGDNILKGGLGNDTVSYLTASQGVTVDLLHNGLQQVTHGSGSDTLFSIENLTGSQYDDQLTGNGLSNILNGGYGQDILKGLGGNDFFVFASIDEVGDTLATADRIVDFKAGDKIDLSGMDANDGTTTNDSFVEMIDALTPFTLAGQLKFAKGALWGNTDSDPGVEFSIVQTGVSALQLSDIIL